MELRRRHIICCLFLVRPLLLENDYKSRPKSCILLVRNFLTIHFTVTRGGGWWRELLGVLKFPSISDLQYTISKHSPQ